MISSPLFPARLLMAAQWGPVTAVIINPFTPVHLPRASWMFLDVVILALLGWVISLTEKQLELDFIAHLAARAYSRGSIDAHHWALKGFLAWADSQNLDSPAAFTRATLETYQLHLHHYRSPRTKEALVANTQLARLGCVRRFFA